MSELEYVEIFPKIYVYRNVLKDPKQMYDVMNESEKTRKIRSAEFIEKYLILKVVIFQN